MKKIIVKLKKSMLKRNKRKIDSRLKPRKLARRSQGE
jgi:hypothetical protein